MKTLTSKAIRVLDKRHASIPEITKQYGISEEELFQIIQKFFPQHEEARRIWSNLKKNTKREKAGVNQANSNSEQSINPSEQEQVASILSFEETAQGQLSQLKEEEAKLSLALMNLEAQHKALVTANVSFRGALLALKKRLNALDQAVGECRKEFSKTLEEIQFTSERMAEVNEMRKETSFELSKLRAKIFELQKVTIFFYEDGTLEAENTKISAVSSEALSKLFGELVLYPQASEFSVTLKEVKSIAQLLLWTEELKSKGISFEIVFDRESVESFYRLVSA